VRGPHSVSVGIAAIPLERRRLGQVFEQAVIHDVLAEAIRLQVPLQGAEGGFQMAVGAAEMPLEGEPRTEERRSPGARRSAWIPSARGVALTFRAAVSITEMVRPSDSPRTAASHRETAPGPWGADPTGIRVTT